MPQEKRKAWLDFLAECRDRETDPGSAAQPRAMIRVTGPVWLWAGEGGSWHFISIPVEEAVEVRLESAASGIKRGFGSVRVKAEIKGVAWKTSIFPQKSGGYLLPVKASVRRDAGIAADDIVTVKVELL